MSRLSDAWGTVVAFSLTENAFAQLGVSIRSRSDKIDEAFEDAVIDDPASEAALLKIKQDLTFPKLRIESEVRWMIDIAPKKAEQILAALVAGNADRTLRFLEDDASGLSAANIAADACRRFDPHPFISGLIDTHAGITAAQVSDEINAARVVSGFGMVAAPQVKDALARVSGEHARAIVEALAEQPNPGSVLAKFTTGRSSPFVDVVIETFDRWAAPKLREVEEGAKDVLTELDASASGDVEDAIGKLKQWAEISEPVQRHHEAKGLDEPRSLKLYYAARSAAISLANDHQQYDAAHQLTSAMSHVFQLLPSARRQLAIDIEALYDLKLDVARQARVRPLEEHVSGLTGRMSQTVRLLETQTWSSEDLAGLDRKFDEAREAGDVDELALGVIRSLALRLNADDHPRAAHVLLHRYLAKLSDLDSELAVRFEDDLAILRRNADQKDLMRALEHKNFSAAEEIVAIILSYERDEELRNQLLHIRAGLGKRKSDRSAKIIGWVVIGLILAGWFFVSQATDSSRRSPSAYDPSVGYASDSDAAADAAQAADEAASASTYNATPSTYGDPIADPYAEPYRDPYADVPTMGDPLSAPAVGAGPQLSQSEIESCLEEDALLTRLRSLTTTDNAIDRFNARVRSYNASCGAYQYRQDDMNRAQIAVSGRSAMISAEAKRLSDEWSYD